MKEKKFFPFLLTPLPFVFGQFCGLVEVPPVEQVEEPLSPPLPRVLAPEIIEPLPPQELYLTETLRAVKANYIWARVCYQELFPPPEDPLGAPDPGVLRISYRAPLKSFHQIYLWWDFPAWPFEIVEAKLRLFCLDTDPASFFAKGVLLGQLEEEWQALPLEPDIWSFYCNEELPKVESWSDFSWLMPKQGEWYELDVWEAMREWQTGESPNYGVVLDFGGPSGSLAFASPAWPEVSERPEVRIRHLPFLLKLPLPGCKAWLLTTEAYGGDCASSWIDPYHQGESLDFAPVSCSRGIIKEEAEVPVLAAASGEVLEIGIDENHPNGCFVILQHGEYFTYYLHLEKNSVAVTTGECVAQGRELGLMGNSGLSTGRHLHFAVKRESREGWGGKEVPGPDEVLLEGRPLKDWAIHCHNGVRVTYYESTNTP